MPLIDISVPLTTDSTPIYPGDPKFEITSWASIEAGDPANVSCLHFGAHTGTHLDAPAHFLQGGHGIPDIPLAVLLGDAVVVEIPDDVSSIEISHVTSLVPGGWERVLFKTRNSRLWEDSRGRFADDFAYISPTGAQALVDLGVRLVGFDYLSVEKFGSTDFETHKILLSRSIVIIEGLNLRAVSAGAYELICLPLRIAAGAGDGAPARAVLRTLRNQI